ncbi:Apical endosomal glycoprotein-like protein, partial [Leptotrombidium deliense]
KEILRCDFDGNLCDWSVFNGSAIFENGANSSKVKINGPLTFIFSSGSFLKLQKRNEIDLLTLVSSLIKTPPKSVCITFHYYLFAADSKLLEFYKTNEQNEEFLLWSQLKSTSDKWRTTRLSLQTEEKSFSLKFKVLSNDVAFDSIFVTEGNCSFDGFCDFESDTCSFKQEEKNKNGFYWKRGKNSDSPGNTLPGVDHTTSLHGGHYLYTLNNNQNNLGVTTLSSSVIDFSFGTHCLSFWFYRQQENRDELNVWSEDAKDATTRRKLWSTIDNDFVDAEKWQFAQTSVASTTSFRIVFEALKKQTGIYTTTIALDDIRLNTQPCTPLASCDFNIDMCGFIADVSNVTFRHGYGRVKNDKNMQDSYIPPDDPTTKNVKC